MYFILNQIMYFFLEGDPHKERAFWSYVSLNSPLYGADTP